MIFVSGTDTHVGKTLIASALTIAWKQRGFRIGVMKPCETGCTERAEDAERLRWAAESTQTIEEIAPYRFTLPASPEEAARAEQRYISCELIQRTFQQNCQHYEKMVVEGAGGLFVPVTKESYIIDIVKQLNLPLLLVARSGLGTVNHTLLSLQAARSFGITVQAIVLVQSTQERDPSEASNPYAIAYHGDVSVLGPVPYLENYPPNKEQLLEIAEKYLISIL